VPVRGGGAAEGRGAGRDAGVRPGGEQAVVALRGDRAVSRVRAAAYADVDGAVESRVPSAMHVLQRAELQRSDGEAEAGELGAGRAGGAEGTGDRAHRMAG